MLFAAMIMGVINLGNLSAPGAFDNVTPSGLGWSLGVAITAATASILFSKALELGGDAAAVAAITSVYPAVTLIIGVLFLGDELTGKKVRAELSSPPLKLVSHVPQAQTEHASYCCCG